MSALAILARLRTAACVRPKKVIPPSLSPSNPTILNFLGNRNACWEVWWKKAIQLNMSFIFTVSRKYLDIFTPGMFSHSFYSCSATFLLSLQSDLSETNISIQVNNLVYIHTTNRPFNQSKSLLIPSSSNWASRKIPIAKSEAVIIPTESVAHRPNQKPYRSNQNPFLNLVILIVGIML